MSEQVRQIAMRIKELRELSDCSVAEVAQATEVSEEDYLSYESGHTDIPISFLIKISNFFHVDSTTILTGEAPRLSVCAVTRKNMGVVINRSHHYHYKNLAYNFHPRKIEPLLVEVAPGVNADMQTNSHEGHEFDYVLSGVLRLKVGDRLYELEPGDSAYYDSIHPHAMQAATDETCTFLAMVIP